MRDGPARGDYVIIKRVKEGMNNKHIPYLPKDCVEKLGRVAHITDEFTRVNFDFAGIRMNDGQIFQFIDIPNKKQWHYLMKVEMLYLDKFERVGDAQLVPAKELMILNGHWYKRRGGWESKHTIDMVEDLEKCEMRHPPVCAHDLQMAFGSNRLAAHVSMKRERCPCYITTSTHAELVHRPNMGAK